MSDLDELKALINMVHHLEMQITDLVEDPDDILRVSEQLKILLARQALLKTTKQSVQTSTDYRQVNPH